MSKTLALTEELITLSSVTPEDKGCQQRMAELLTPLGFVCESIQSGAVTNLWAIPTSCQLARSKNGPPIPLRPPTATANSTDAAQPT